MAARGDRDGAWIATQPSSDKRRPKAGILFLAMIAMSSVFLNAFIGFIGGEKRFLRELDKTVSEGNVVKARKDMQDRIDFAQTAMIRSCPVAIGMPFVLVALLGWTNRAPKKKGNWRSPMSRAARS